MATRRRRRLGGRRTQRGAGSGRQSTVVESDGEASRLLDAWADHDLAVVVDAVCSGAAPGTIHVWDDVPDLPATSPATGSHAMGVGDAVALGRALDRLPTRLIVIGIEVDDTSAGHGLSSSVTAAVDDAADVIVHMVTGAATP